MIKFTQGQINTVKITVISAENLDGFYMRIGIYGISKKVMPLSSKGTIVEYSAAEIDGRIGGHCGQYVIYDNLGRERKTGRILCSLNTTNITPSQQSLVVTMPKEFVADAPDGLRKSDFSGVEIPKSTVSSMVKWATQITSILQGITQEG